MNIIFQVNGGLGKNVMATALCKSIKVKYPESKLIVVTGYPDVYLNNPNVDRCITLQEAKYFYKDFVEDKEILYLGQEPYLTTSYINDEANLIKIWCDMYDLPVTKLAGEIFLTKREVDFYSRKHNLDTPYTVLQTSGSSGELMYNWGRDIPSSVVNSIVKNNKDTKIYHVKTENQIDYQGTIPFTDNIRAMFVLVSMSNKRIFMDSCCQHIAAAFDLPSNVFWITTSPKVFGYETNNNILANPETKPISLSSSFLKKYELVPNMQDFPYNNEAEIFNTETLNLI